MNNTEMSTAPYHYSCLPQAIPLQCFLCLSTQVIFVSLCLAIVGHSFMLQLSLSVFSLSLVMIRFGCSSLWF